MSEYKHVLAAIDLSDEAPQVINRAHALAASSGAKLSLVHVIEPLTFAYGGDIPVDLSEIQNQLEQQATEKLNELATTADVTSDNQHILVGPSVAEIHALADQLSVDLVVLGSHGRQGLARLLGSTANGVLHGANCDVLAVRVKDS